MKDIKEFRKEDFKAYDSVYINPAKLYNRIYGIVIANTDYTHDSGYKCIRAYALDIDNNIIGTITDYSDVIHINGIGGYGKYSHYIDSPTSDLVERKSFSIDLLPCGYFRIFKDRSHPFDFNDFIGSDLEIF